MMSEFTLHIDQHDTHVHFRVFVNGALAGKLCMRGSEYYEFEKIIKLYLKLLEACKKSKWLYDHLALSPIAAACKYGDNYEPLTKEKCLEVIELLNEILDEAKE